MKSYAQTDAPAFTITLDRDHIVAGESWHLSCYVPGVPTVIYKTPDKGWLSVRLLDADGKEVGSFEPTEGAKSITDKAFQPTVFAQAKATLQTDVGTGQKLEQGDVSEGDNAAIHYFAPKLTWNGRIALPQTNSITKIGVYRLVVRAKRYFVPGTSGLRPETPDEAKLPELKGRRLIKGNKTFRVNVTAVGVEALKLRAAELRETAISGVGPQRLQAEHDLVNWPADKALDEWRSLVRDPRYDQFHTATFAKEIYQQGSPNAIRFLGELTWDMNKANARLFLHQLYYNGDAATKKQIAGLYASHGEDVTAGPKISIE